MSSPTTQLQTRLWSDVKDLYKLLPTSAADRMSSDQKGKGNFTAVGCVRAMQESASLEYSGMAMVRLRGQPEQSAHVRGRARPLPLTYETESVFEPENEPMAGPSGSTPRGTRMASPRRKGPKDCCHVVSNENLNGSKDSTKSSGSGDYGTTQGSPAPASQGRQALGGHRSTPRAQRPATLRDMLNDRSRAQERDNLQPMPYPPPEQGPLVFNYESDNDEEEEMEEMAYNFNNSLFDESVLRSPEYEQGTPSPAAGARRQASTSTAASMSPNSRRPSSTHTARRPSNPYLPDASEEWHTPAATPDGLDTSPPNSPFRFDNGFSPLPAILDRPAPKRSRSFVANKTDETEPLSITKRRSKSTGQLRNCEIRAEHVRASLVRAAGLQRVSVAGAQTEYLCKLVEWHVYELLVAVAALAQRQQHGSVRVNDLRQLLADPANQQLKDIFNQQ